MLETPQYVASVQAETEWLDRPFPSTLTVTRSWEQLSESSISSPKTEPASSLLYLSLDLTLWTDDHVLSKICPKLKESDDPRQPVNSCPALRWMASSRCG